MYPLYRLLTRMGAGLAAPVLGLRRFRTHAERLGSLGPEIAESIGSRPVIWVHSASVGELLSSVALLRGLRARRPRAALVVSTTSLAGRELARSLPETDAAFLLPLDAPAPIARVIDTLRPVLFVFTETEIWPNLLEALDRRGVPAVLLSGRISPRAFRRYLWVKRFLRSVLAHVRAFGMQSEAEAARIRALGAAADRVRVTGSLKLEAIPGSPAFDIEGDGPLWVAGSTHAGEEEACVTALAGLRRRFPTLRAVIAPRHLGRLPEVERSIERAGLRFCRRSDLAGPWRGEPEILLLDTLGELAGLYPLASVAFVGGTLVSVGGHNLLEPARAGAPVLFGPNVANVPEMAAALEASGGGRRVRDSAELEAAIAELLADGERRATMGRRAAETFPADAVTERSLDLVTALLREGA